MNNYFPSNQCSFPPFSTSKKIVQLFPQTHQPYQESSPPQTKDNFENIFPQQEVDFVNDIQYLYSLQQLYHIDLLPNIKRIFNQVFEEVSVIQRNFEESEVTIEQASTEVFKIDYKKEEISSIEIKNEDIKKEDINNVKICILDQDQPSLESRIEQMLWFLLKNYNEDTFDEIQLQRQIYESDQNFNDLLELFDELIARYSSTVKLRESLSRFVIKKAISTIQSSYKNDNKVSSKEAVLCLCKRYSLERVEELNEEENGNNDYQENDEKINDILVPYKKKSSKKVNKNFIQKIFASEEFYQDFLKFFEKFDQILEIERMEKSRKFVKFLCKCVEKNDLSLIQKFQAIGHGLLDPKI